MAELRPGWIALVLLRNMAIVTVWYGVWHLRLYVRKDKLRGTATVSLAAGETVSVTVRVEEPAPVQ